MYCRLGAACKASVWRKLNEVNVVLGRNAENSSLSSDLPACPLFELMVM